MRHLYVIVLLLIMPLSARAAVLINEVAWMGTEADWRNEWIELANTDTAPIAVDGWTLSTIDGELSITLSGTVASGSFYLIERTDDLTLPDISANLVSSFGKGGLSNGGETLVLKDASGTEQDSVDGSDNWAIGGDNGTKETLQRTVTGWITALATPKAANGLPSDGAGEGASDSAAGDSAGTEESEPIPTVVSGSVNVPAPEPRIFALAGDDVIAIVGADAAFSGLAFGKTGEPVERAQYLWTFGDGSWARGKDARHAYQFPGEYVTVLNVSGGSDTASDQIRVRVEPNHLLISEIFPGADSWIELANNSARTIDISRWGISLQKNGARVPEQTFWFPETTRILPHAYVVISGQTLGFHFPYLKGVTELLYPNGARADTFLYSGATDAGKSFQRVEEEVFVAAATPATANIVPVIPAPKLFVQPPSVPKAIDRTISMSDSLLVQRKQDIAEEISDTREYAGSDISLLRRDAEPVTASALAVTDGLAVPSSHSRLGWVGLVLALGVTAGIGIVFARRGF